MATIRSQEKGMELTDHPIEPSIGYSRLQHCAWNLWPQSCEWMNDLCRSEPPILWYYSMLATTRQDPAAFSERCTDVPYLAAPSALRRAGAGNHPCIPAGTAERRGGVPTLAWKQSFSDLLEGMMCEEGRRKREGRWKAPS